MADSSVDLLPLTAFFLAFVFLLSILGWKPVLRPVSAIIVSKLMRLRGWEAEAGFAGLPLLALELSLPLLPGTGGSSGCTL